MDQIKIELQEWLSGDKGIANAAWTSSTDKAGKEFKTEEDVKRVVNMLADKKHSVPFESVVFRFWFRIPVATDRQLMTHRIASHSGMSGRYRTLPSDFLAVADDVTKILKKCDSQPFSTDNMLSLVKDYDQLCTWANEWYQQVCTELKDLKTRGVIDSDELKRVREFMRGVLPQHNMTERVTVMNLRSFANFYKLRSKPDAQPEIRYLSERMLEEIVKADVCPIAISALERNSWVI